MTHIPPTYVVLQTECGSLELRPLKCGDRARFLEYRAAAYRFLQSDSLTQFAAERGFLPAFRCALQSPEFAHAVGGMLALHGLSLDQVDTHQVVALLFSYEGGDGLLVQLEFPPLPTDGKPLDPDLDPYHYLIAVLYYRDGNLARAKASVDSLTYAEICGTLKALTSVANQTDSPRAKGTAPSEEERAAALAKAKAKFQAMAQQSNPGEDPGLAAIRRAQSQGVE